MKNLAYVIIALCAAGAVASIALLIMALRARAWSLAMVNLSTLVIQVGVIGFEFWVLRWIEMVA